ARSQSPHCTAAAPVRGAAGGTGSKTGLREGGEEGRTVTHGERQESTGSATKATQGAEAHSRQDRSWVEASIWTERMLSALDNGVKGGKRFSLIDKVMAAKTPE